MKRLWTIAFAAVFGGSCATGQSDRSSEEASPPFLPLPKDVGVPDAQSRPEKAPASDRELESAPETQWGRKPVETVLPEGWQAPATTTIGAIDERRMASIFGNSRAQQAMRYDPIAGPMFDRLARHEIMNHSPETLKRGLARYDSRTAALAYRFVADSLQVWLFDETGPVAQSVVRVDSSMIRLASSSLRYGLELDTAMRERAPRAVGIIDEERSPLSGDEALEFLSRALMPSDLWSIARLYANLVVVPDGDISSFPFALLRVGELERDRFLIDEMNFSIAPALAEVGIGYGLHRNVGEERDRTKQRWNALVVGDPAYGDPSLPQLPGARAEAEFIGELFGVEPLVGAAATLDATTAAIRRSSPVYIHFATHGVADRLAARGNDSWLALANGERLDGRAIRRNRLADGSIVVLSACQSGLGAVRPGGIVGLPRMLQLGGAQSVVMSLWRVDDVTTERLMALFAEKLKATGRAASALTAATQIIKSEHPDEPAKWAAFETFGTAQF